MTLKEEEEILRNCDSKIKETVRYDREQMDELLAKCKRNDDGCIFFPDIQRY